MLNLDNPIGEFALQVITGTWQLINTECIAADGKSLAPPYGGTMATGIVSMNSDGRLICVLCDGRADIPVHSREYNSYCGSYSYDRKQLVTRVDAASNPDWIGTDQIRDVAFEDDVMVLRPAQNTGPVSDGQRVLYWIRLPDAQT